MRIEQEDVTGRLPSVRDVEEAKNAVVGAFRSIGSLPPELAVQLPNILRCLEIAEFILTRAEREDSI